jgi:hypothetical protein
MNCYHDGVPPHFRRAVKTYPSLCFPSRGVPQNCPPRSPCQNQQRVETLGTLLCDVLDPATAVKCSLNVAMRATVWSQRGAEMYEYAVAEGSYVQQLL